MKYNLNEEVFVLDSENSKTIVDYEIVDGKEIYYMSDNTSYESNQIKLTLSQYFELRQKFHENHTILKNHIVNALQTYWDNRNKIF